MKPVVQFLAKFWDFLWNDDSALSWVLNIVVAFLLIKYLVYPGLGVVFGTQFPIVAVVSGSMEHDGSFEDWWNSAALCPHNCPQREFYSIYNISKDQFQTFDYRDGFNTGDIMMLVGVPAKHLQVGEIVVFFSAKGEPIIHRIVDTWQEGDAYYVQTKGDHNTNSIATPGLTETRIPEDLIIGKAVLRVPYLGWIKIGFFNAVSKVGYFFNRALS